VELINTEFKCAMPAACSDFNGTLPNFLSLLRTSWQLQKLNAHVNLHATVNKCRKYTKLTIHKTKMKQKYTTRNFYVYHPIVFIRILKNSTAIKHN